MKTKGLAVWQAQTSGVKQTGGDIVVCAGSRGYLLHRRRATVFGENTGLCGLGFLVCWFLACLMGGWMDAL